MLVLTRVRSFAVLDALRGFKRGQKPHGLPVCRSGASRDRVIATNSNPSSQLHSRGRGSRRSYRVTANQAHTGVLLLTRVSGFAALGELRDFKPEQKLHGHPVGAA
ncbi:hypothetical protein [Lysobacter capsici]|uniref:hypothetical protein n=1 Tax=Lysobacter capsici TaxID=435897 RepID=UPI0012FE4F87|nr:hypothetical protein [Lysobacter capsici]